MVLDRPGSYYLQVLGNDFRRAVRRQVVFAPKRFEILSESSLAVSIQSSERLLGRAVVSSKMLDDVFGTHREIKVDLPPGHSQI